MFVDADAVGQWIHEESIDGLADFVFWGRDAAAVADRFGAPRDADGQFGWRDCPIEELVELALPIESARSGAEFKFATDFRPHSHHWMAMQEVRSSRLDAGTIEVGGADLCVFMTTWGDGIFEVVADLAEDGNLVSVRILLESEVSRQRIRAVNP